MGPAVSAARPFPLQCNGFRHHTATHFASKATAHLWIEEPLDKESNKGETKWNHLFDTHPPIDDRIHALEQM